MKAYCLTWSDITTARFKGYSFFVDAESAIQFFVKTMTTRPLERGDQNIFGPDAIPRHDIGGFVLHEFEFDERSLFGKKFKAHFYKRGDLQTVLPMHADKKTPPTLWFDMSTLVAAGKRCVVLYKERSQINTLLRRSRRRLLRGPAPVRPPRATPVLRIVAPAPPQPTHE